MLAVLFTVSACTSDERSGARFLASPPGPLVGTWDLALRLERPITFATDAGSLPRRSTGRIALLETHTEQPSTSQQSVAMYSGVYDIDLSSLGFPSQSASAIRTLVARSAPRSGSTVDALRRDSVYMTFNPDAPQNEIRLIGTFAGDSVVGVWTTDTFLGGGGTFTLRRAHSPND
jgi:hypothetical protein